MNVDELRPGTVLTTEHRPIEPLDLSWFLVATDDRNRIHVDRDFAAQAGFHDVVVQGMYVLGLMGAHLVQTFGVRAVRRLGADFVRPTFPGEPIVARYEVTQRSDLGHAISLEWSLEAESEAGERKLRGRSSTIHDLEGSAS